MARVTWAQRLLHGSLWVLKHPYCHQARPPPWVRGSMQKKKVLQDLALNPHTAAAIRKDSFDRPTCPHRPKMGYPGTGGGGGGWTSDTTTWGM